MANNNSANIRTAFILSIIAGASGELFIIFLYTRGIISYGSVFNFGNLFIVSCLCSLPLVLAIIALSLLAKAKPVTTQDRVFRILARIFSIISVVEGAGLIFLYLLIMLIVFMVGVAY